MFSFLSLSKPSKLLSVLLFQKPSPNKALLSLKSVNWTAGESDHKKHTMLHHIKSEVLKTIKFCKIIYRDGDWLLKKRYRMIFQDESATIKEIHKMTNTRIDLLK